MAYIPNPLIIPIGMLIGVLIALPIGPVNLLGLQRAVERGFFGGMAMGIGIMIGDGLIALGAAMGVNALSGAIRQYRTVIQIIGGLALMVAAAQLFFNHPQFVPHAEAEKATLADYAWDIPRAFLLTIANPSAVIGTAAIFGGVSTFVEVSSYIDAFTMVASVMGGSFLYWLVVSRWISSVRHSFDVSWMPTINKFAGIFLASLGVAMIGEMVVKQLQYWHWYWY